MFNQVIFIFSTIVQGFVWAQHAKIGNYSELNIKLCGLSRLSLEIENACFEWHPNFLNKMSNARNVTFGESPWTVLVKFTKNGTLTDGDCTGSLIAEDWVLTAAHCLVEGHDRIDIYTGYDYLASKPTSEPYRALADFPNTNFIIPSPDPNDDGIYTDPDYDIGLIKLSRKVEDHHVICLPERKIKNDKKEYIVVSGWGRTAEQGVGLQTGYRIMYEYPSDFTFSHYSKDGKARICYADSGAPIWQYFKGRAVQIGVLTSSDSMEKEDEFGCVIQPGNSDATRVSFHIDWILDTIKKNKN